MLEKYSEEIKDISKFDNDLKGEFGHVNVRWVFAEVAKDLSYEIFMSQVDNVGYKRTKRGENPMPNDLFDMEIAPDKNPVSKVEPAFDKDIKALSDKLVAEKAKSNKSDDKIEDLEKKVAHLKENKSDIIERLNNLYDTKGLLLDKERTNIEKVRELFKNEYLKPFFNSDVMLREDNELVLLDYIRAGVTWD